mmetsp:Transcript_65612/g.143034  ORF Transcript_65612/g.143034 Transcript_65612/m.143034 type:complete len:202 (-) Transcript_65612:1397-2002(-)
MLPPIFRSDSMASIRPAISHLRSASRVSTRLLISLCKVESIASKRDAISARSSLSMESTRATNSARSWDGRSPRAARADRSRPRAESIAEESMAATSEDGIPDPDIGSRVAPKFRISSLLAAISRSRSSCNSLISAFLSSDFAVSSFCSSANSRRRASRSASISLTIPRDWLNASTCRCRAESCSMRSLRSLARSALSFIT